MDEYAMYSTNFPTEKKTQLSNKKNGVKLDQLMFVVTIQNL
jgi:hypothetical protein